MYNCRCMPSAEDMLVTPALATTFAGKCSVTDFNVLIEKYVFILECRNRSHVYNSYLYLFNNIGTGRNPFPYAYIVKIA